MMHDDVLQKLIENVGRYLLVERHTHFSNALGEQNYWEPLLIAPDVPLQLQGKKIDELLYKDVKQLADTEIKTIIHLGKSYQPFQYGIRNKEFTRAEIVSCEPMELIVRCYTDNLKDYNDIRSLMEKLTKK